MIEKWNNPMSPKSIDEVVLNHLRVGYTHYTNGPLLKKSHQEHVLNTEFFTSI